MNVVSLLLHGICPPYCPTLPAEFKVQTHCAPALLTSLDCDQVEDYFAYGTTPSGGVPPLNECL